MKTLPILLSMLVLASCANQPPPASATIREHIYLVGAKSDLAPGPRLQPTPSDQSLCEGGGRQLGISPSYAVVCDAAKDSCKHAAVKTELINYSATVTKDRSVSISGVLVMELGRRVEVVVKTDSGEFKEGRSVPDGIELIDVGTRQFPFQKVLPLGEAFVVKGDLGVEAGFKYVEDASKPPCIGKQ